jgi:hypothetical protein
MFLRYVTPLLALLMLVLGATTASGQIHDDAPGSRQRLFKDIVAARSRAIDAAFPGFIAIAQFELAIASSGCSRPTAQLACYDALENTLMFDRKVLSGLDSRLLEAAEDYWVFYEHSELRDAFPIIGIIDAALWSAFMNEIAQQYDITWPHGSCGSMQLAIRLGCEMLVSGIDSHLRFRHSRIYNANRIDIFWPDSLTPLEQKAWRSDDPEYGLVRELGGVELLQPLIKEFGVTRVFAYVAQTPFSIEGSNVRVSALRYQERARSALHW